MITKIVTIQGLGPQKKRSGTEKGSEMLVLDVLGRGYVQVRGCRKSSAKQGSKEASKPDGLRANENRTEPRVSVLLTV